MEGAREESTASGASATLACPWNSLAAWAPAQELPSQDLTLDIQQSEDAEARLGLDEC